MPGSALTKHHERDVRKRRSPTPLSVSSTPASTPSASLASAFKRPKGKDRSASAPAARQQYSTADDDSSTSAGMGSPPVRVVGTPPKELFVGSTTATKIMGTEITVSSLVGVRLFPQIKFVCNPTVELMFCRDARSICGVVMSECSPPVTITEEDWWEHARKWIGKQVSVLRNSKNTQMKWSFMGKL